MFLKSIALKGFKSFPARTKLDFGPGVSVIVGPNGSGKSNIADAVVWALGEQSATAIRGHSMQDFLFGGAPGIASAPYAEVELTFDNTDGTLGGSPGSEFRELAITRKLARDGEGEYRINGARCRLSDVVEVLSDTGLGKEMHSVLSQGKVDHVVGSKPRDRRLLIEEAAGLGKHRKRRRRAQMKLAKTRDNLDRVLDVEREARTRLKPLKRQAEAAETHERLEHQANELKALILADRLLAADGELTDAQGAAKAARVGREELDGRLGEIAREREQAEGEIAAQAAEREQVAHQLFEVRSACERIELRREQTAERAARIADEIDRCEAELAQLELAVDPGVDETRSAQIESELAALAAEADRGLDEQLAVDRDRLTAAQGEQQASTARHATAQQTVTDAEARAAEARRVGRERREALDQMRRNRAALDGELAAVEQFLHESSTNHGDGALAERIAVEPGYEQAVAAVLSHRLGAAVVESLDQANALLDDRGEAGGAVLVARGAGADAAAGPGPAGGIPLADKLTAQDGAADVVRGLLRGVWVVESLATITEDFTGIAVTRGGRVWFGAGGEVRQAPSGGEQRELTARNRRAALTGELATARDVESDAATALEQSHARIAGAEAALEGAHEAERAARRERDEAASAVDAIAAAIARRREEGAAHGPLAVRRAALEAELRSERAHADSVAQARALQQRRHDRIADQLKAAQRALPVVTSLYEALTVAATVARDRAETFADGAANGRVGAHEVAERLRALAAREAELQARLREAGEQVTATEVRAQRAQDAQTEVTAELELLTQALGAAAPLIERALATDERDDIEAKLARIARRRELLGPINPLAKGEYAEAVAHVEELETQRSDLETALNELDDLIGEIDRTIRTAFEQTFDSTSTHFHELVARLFPGGTGELRLVTEERAATAPLTVQTDDDEPGADDADEPAVLPEDPDAADQADAADDYGVEIHVKLPGSKTGRRLSLLSGGERSLVALAFLFAVFLTRPCPFYIFDEAEAALDDINIDRLVALLREHSEHSQFIVITHQKRTMDAADQLYGVSMGADGVTKVITRRLSRDEEPQAMLEPAPA